MFSVLAPYECSVAVRPGQELHVLVHADERSHDRADQGVRDDVERGRQHESGPLDVGVVVALELLEVGQLLLAGVEQVVPEGLLGAPAQQSRVGVAAGGLDRSVKVAAVVRIGGRRRRSCGKQDRQAEQNDDDVAPARWKANKLAG